MANYKLTKRAVVDLANIWDYTFEMWSEDQAEKYYESLIATCQDIADNPALGISYQGIEQDLIGMKSNQHIIFFRNVEETYVEITRIIHEKMDLRNRILG